ncbi:hypothetical protein QBC33DRAFT_2650 [Phialemonium atrogriseum]|uniref:Uncharacterized protein n=1 Tax=Phialemonium atrogriseum TaxID=1093897 RepID=A0AAJ0FL35_9PEZI|nr:uncharacterized protein QBC33DRAFT_2650 [Phialemonium atrogriseum]KAK1772241.1 hypothetical protein QBC33DRAFT_2650 [Phialemonium atrogriseum]
MSSGLSDEAVIEGHDLIERAETEEREAHKGHSNLQSTESPKPSAGSKDNAEPADTLKSKLDSVKEALNLKK